MRALSDGDQLTVYSRASALSVSPLTRVMELGALMPGRRCLTL